MQLSVSHTPTWKHVSAARLTGDGGEGEEGDDDVADPVDGQEETHGLDPQARGHDLAHYHPDH